MLTPPTEIMVILSCFAQVFSERTWDWVQVLVVGAILAPGKRTVSSVLTAVGLSQEKQYQRYHRVLNRSQWSGLEVSKILLGLLVTLFVASGGTVVLGADETLERRTGNHIQAKGVFRDAVRSSRKYTVKAFGLRWVSMMVLVQGALEFAGVGIAVFDGAGTQRENQSRQRQAPQNQYRLGHADDEPGATLVARL